MTDNNKPEGLKRIQSLITNSGSPINFSKRLGSWSVEKLGESKFLKKYVNANWPPPKGGSYSTYNDESTRRDVLAICGVCYVLKLIKDVQEIEHIVNLPPCHLKKNLARIGLIICRQV